MKLQFIALSQLVVSKANMRARTKAPDVTDILPTIRKRGVLVPILVRAVAPEPQAAEGGVQRFEIVAGARRFHAARIVAEERAGEFSDTDALPCAVLDHGDDAAMVEASLIENVARLDPDEVTRWETFTRLVKEGREPADIAATFGLPDLAVKRVLALGNLMPRIRDLYRREKIDRATIRHLTLATKARQRDWLALYDDPEARCPTGHGLKAWLLGGQSIPVRHALFDVAGHSGVVADLFGEDAYFSDSNAFWAAQNAAVAARRENLLGQGWNEVVVVPPEEHFHTWEHEKAAKRKGGRVYIDVRSSGEVTIHEGYLTRKEARRVEKGESIETDAKPARAEVTSALGTYIDLHRHAATRAALLGAAGVALRLMLAHAVVGSPLWTVKPEPQATRDDAVSQSVSASKGETAFDLARLKALRLLGLSEDEPRVTGGSGDGFRLVGLFLRLMSLGDEDVMTVLAVVMGETLHAGSAAVDAVATEVGIDMAQYWQADDALFDLIRDREVLVAMVGDVAGPKVAEANAKEPGKVLKGIIRAHLAGSDGRAKVENWVPRWLAFPPATYTARGGVGSVEAHACAQAARAQGAEDRAAAEADSSARDTTAPLAA
ncbi:MAG: ParB/RepB/Spo0J family partition protein [Novosphingobium sp.]|nr:MAG: ParB/RepB/Spo0J family partition protein [Novosphingobium sp.]